MEYCSSTFIYNFLAVGFTIILSLFIIVIAKRSSRMMFISGLAYLVFGLVIFIYFIILHTIPSIQELRPANYMNYKIQEILVAIDIIEGLLRIGGCILMLWLQKILKVEVKRKNESCNAIYKRKEALMSNQHDEVKHEYAYSPDETFEEHKQETIEDNHIKGNEANDVDGKYGQEYSIGSFPYPGNQYSSNSYHPGRDEVHSME